MGRGVWGDFALPYDGWSRSEQYFFWINEMFFEGTSRAIFSMLFGASFMMQVRDSMHADSPIQSVDRYFRRCLWMLLIGVFHATVLLWPGDILFHYALPGMALLPFRTTRPRTLLWLAGVLMIILNAGEGKEDISLALLKNDAEIAQQKQKEGFALNDKEETAIEDWSEAILERGVDTEEIEEETRARQTYWGSLAHQSAIWIEWLEFDAYVWMLEAFAFMIIGIAFFRLNVLTGERSTRFYILLTLVSLGVGLTINAAETWTKWTTFNGAGVFLDELSYQHGRLGIALSFVGALVVAFRTRTGAFLLRPLQVIGRMALTNYLGHSIVAAIMFTGCGLFGKLGNWQLWGLAVLIWVVQYVCSYAWLSRFRMGPCEWIWRSLACGEIQQLRMHKLTYETGPVLR
jgi:uncharacterized protein